MSAAEVDSWISLRWTVPILSIMVAVHRLPAVPGVVVMCAVLIGGSVICKYDACFILFYSFFKFHLPKKSWQMGS